MDNHILETILTIEDKPALQNGAIDDTPATKRFIDRMGLDEEAPIVAGIVFIVAILVLPFWSYFSNAPTQPLSAINAIRLLMRPFPSIFLLGGIAFAIFYSLGRERHAEVRT